MDSGRLKRILKRPVGKYVLIVLAGYLAYCITTWLMQPHSHSLTISISTQ